MSEYSNSFVQQKNGASALACVAMVASLDYDQLLSTYAGLANDDANLYGIRHVLSMNNILNVSYNDPVMVGGRLYIINVPSLNTTGKLHTIVVDLRAEQPIIVDPNFGVEDLKIYATVDDISHYVNILEVIIFPKETEEETPPVAQAEVIDFPVQDTLQ